MEYDEQISNIMLFPFMWEQNSCIFSRIHCFVAYIGRAISATDKCQFTSFKFLHKIQQTHAKRFDSPKQDAIDRVHSTCVFFGPVHLKGNGPFEVINLEELEAVFQSVS